MKKLVFDVGASAIKYALMDEDAQLFERGMVKTPQDTLAHFLAELKSLYETYEAQIDGIAMSLPGTIDSELGKIYAPGGLAYNENVNLVEQMHAFTNLPIVLENDGKSAALAELWKGNLQECRDGVVLVIGSGIGGGIIVDGRLRKGSHLFAGEFSFVFQGEPNSFMDIWAMKGSTTALLMDVAKRKHWDVKQLDGIQVFDMIAQNDEDACAALKNLAKSIATGIFNLQAILDPKKFLIGGGISKQPVLLSAIQEALHHIYQNIPFEIPHAQVETCRFYNDSNLIGALYQFLQRNAI